MKIYVTLWFFTYTERNDTISEIKSPDLGLDVIETPDGHILTFISKQSSIKILKVFTIRTFYK